MNIALLAASVVLILLSLLPLVRSDLWLVRVWDYPRAQMLVLNLVLIIAIVFFLTVEWFELTLLFALCINFGYLATLVFPYTKLSRVQLKGCKQTEGFSVMIANVFQGNRDYQRCITSIRNANPDLFLLVETDANWVSEITRAIGSDYAYRLQCPLPNTYGMLLCSRLPLVKPRIRFLISHEIPSIVTDIQFGKHLVRFYGLHPEPPVPGENSRSTERDAEILIVGRESKELDVPVVVAGDLNDVAWSYTTELFMKISSLLDPRRGRGFFNTFHAKYFLLRWPLDHVFCSSHFELIDLRRLPGIGSDHFPIFIRLHLNRREVPENEAHELHADKQDIEVAIEKTEQIS